MKNNHHGPLSARANGAAAARKKSRVLISGGAGFIGTNLAHQLLQNGCEVVIYNNLSRPGVEQNLSWLLGEAAQGLEPGMRVAIISGLPIPGSTWCPPTRRCP